jgi:hypothetical protein
MISKLSFTMVLGLTLCIASAHAKVEVKSAHDLEAKIQQAANAMRYLQYELQDSHYGLKIHRSEYIDLINGAFGTTMKDVFLNEITEARTQVISNTNATSTFTYVPRFPNDAQKDHPHSDLGPGWMVDGYIWFDALRGKDGKLLKMDWYNAIKACEDLGAELPSYKRFKELARLLGFKKSDTKYQIPSFLSDLMGTDNLFWSSSGHPIYADFAFFYTGSSGSLDYKSSTYPESVRCGYTSQDSYALTSDDQFNTLKTAKNLSISPEKRIQASEASLKNVTIFGGSTPDGEKVQAIIKDIQKSPLKPKGALKNMTSLIFHQLRCIEEEKTYGVADILIGKDFFNLNSEKKFHLTHQFDLTGQEILELQKTAKVYFDSSVYTHEVGNKALLKTLEGKDEKDDHEAAFRSKSKIVVSENYLLYHDDERPAKGSQENTRFKIFSHAGPNIALGERDHDDFDYRRFASNGTIKEKKFLDFMKVNLLFQLKVMEKEKIEVPVLVALGGGMFSLGYQPQYSEIVARAYREVLEDKNNHFSFKTIVFALPKFSKKEDNIDRYQRSFKGYAGTIPVLLADADVVEISHQLSSQGFAAGLINPANSWSLAGMYWTEEGARALEESLAIRTTLLITQQPHVNLFVLDPRNHSPILVVDRKRINSEESGVDVGCNYGCTLQ